MSAEQRIYFHMNGKQRCFSTVNRNEFNLILRLLTECGYEVGIDIKMPQYLVTREVYLKVSENIEKIS